MSYIIEYEINILIFYNIYKNISINIFTYLLSPKTKSFIIKPIKVTKYLYELNVDFLLNLENIKIQIYDSMGSLVYSNIVDTQTLNQLIIDISYLDNGNYTIRFTNSQDQYLRGNFLIIK
ncbi:MAG: DUF3244 domain-containing protein [Dysgonomonas sp.]